MFPHESLRLYKGRPTVQDKAVWATAELVLLIPRAHGTGYDDPQVLSALPTCGLSRGL